MTDTLEGRACRTGERSDISGAPRRAETCDSEDEAAKAEAAGRSRVSANRMALSDHDTIAYEVLVTLAITTR